MSAPGPFGEGSFDLGRLFGDLARIFSGERGGTTELSRQMAVSIATAGVSEPNVDPLGRARYDDLLRVADLHVASETGLPTSVAGGLIRVVPVSRTEWVERTLADWQPIFDGLASGFGRVVGAAGGPPGDSEDPMAALIGTLGQALVPMLLPMQAGTLVGHLARTSLGQYPLPIPRPRRDEVVVVAPTVTAAAGEWGVPVGDLRLWVLVDELVHHAVLGRPHVHARLTELLTDYAALFEPDLSSLEGRFANIDPADPASWQEALGSDPTALLSAMRSPAQRLLLTQTTALVAVVEGYCDHVVDAVAGRLMPDATAIAAAVRLPRMDRDDSDAMAEGLLGLELSAATYARGASFVSTIVERRGDEALARLWQSERELPTPAEVDAPARWLERIEGTDEPGAFDIPDLPPEA